VKGRAKGEFHSERKQSFEFAERKPLVGASASRLRAQLSFALSAFLRIQRDKAAALHLTSGQ
jgi:hypothetical protein